jgi:hypothetical protein
MELRAISWFTIEFVRNPLEEQLVRKKKNDM